LHEIARGKLARCISDAGKITTLQGKEEEGMAVAETMQNFSKARKLHLFSKVRAI
jgi:hypothetical protein